MGTTVGTRLERREAWEKVTGKAKYTADTTAAGMLYTSLVTSTVAHGKIVNIDTTEADHAAGVISILTGKRVSILSGALLEDRPPLAFEKVRYYGEPVAMVVALAPELAAAAARLIAVEYEPLPAVGTVEQALAPGAPLVHEKLGEYVVTAEDVSPEPGTNIASSCKIRKGDMAVGWGASEVVIERHFSLPASSHAAMETHCADCEIAADGTVTVTTASQSPYTVKKLLAKLFSLEESKVIVKVPLVGGGYGGKSTVELEILAYLASQAAGGRPVRVQFDREQELATTPGRMALEADVKLGATRDGLLQAAEYRFCLDTGAYSDIAPYMAKAMAVDCTGPYRLENVSCDSLCVYTNHNYCTAFRGFSHESFTFCIERALDELAKACGVDALEIRRKNAVGEGDTSPTQVRITRSNTGDLTACLNQLESMANWQEGDLVDIGDNKVRAKGLACLWKTPDPPSNASAGAVITFNSDGSLNLSTGVVEMGSGGQTSLVQMLADKLNMEASRIHVTLGVDTALAPEYYKTVASMTTYIAGRAVMQAADDLVRQLKERAAIALRSPVEDLECGGEKIYLRHLPEMAIGFQDLAFGVKYPDGNTVGGQVIGTGSFVVNHIGPLDPESGKGKAGTAWTVGAQMVEVEYDRTEHTYRLIRAATVMDVGRAIDPELTACLIRGGMSMGLSLASREMFHYSADCKNETTSLRTYKLLHFGQEPRYLVGFVETPQQDAPFGCRACSEHGIIGMPAALGNALSRAADVELNALPIQPENIWQAVRTQRGEKR
ncbi:xanthine dehydrogenase family protein molybdopterin-binding subunit [Clostridiales bacterium BX7]|uniref:Xanthine dehydrogenase family protein molybdopterin-binding subunit n=1 Tax=Feifania hominis TaxID=2763660 RepID=A0A926HTF5_9FIRM|nr:xanthine dehydrogenase family protein molybdopterin-binding subunit [Feifania hominis]MBC8535819.1 xanthine dehydrogenase family protein molybdopterin-binding subunit [Feifania hominis]